MATEEFTEAFIPKQFDGKVETVEVIVSDNNRQIVGHREVSIVESTPGSSGQSFNSVEVPVIYPDSTEEEEDEATKEAITLIPQDL